MAHYTGGCHCGKIAFTLEGEIGDVLDCNCSMCRRKGALLAAFPRAALKLAEPAVEMATYRFNRHAIAHHFCTQCGIAPYSEGKGRDGSAMCMVNVRCLDDVNLSSLNVVAYDGASA